MEIECIFRSLQWKMVGKWIFMALCWHFLFYLEYEKNIKRIIHTMTI
jgi:hypothetical protein